jgi:polyhydroxyalkanoate synthesis repressor PhaR
VVLIGETRHVCEDEPMGETRVVKRYANRKLYDTQRSRYVTLEQIADMIRSGEDVKIVDNNSKEDLTAITLAQIIFEEEKKSSFLPLSALRNIIQTGGNSIQNFASQAGERVRAVFRRDKDGNAVEGEELVPEDGAESGHPIKEFLERSQQTFDEWQKRVDDRIRHTVEGLSPLAGLEKEIRSLVARVAELEKKLEEQK